MGCQRKSHKGRAFSVIVKTDCETDGSFYSTILDMMIFSDRGQGAEAGRRQEAAGGGGRGCQGGQRGPHRHHLRTLQHQLGGLGGCGLR